MFLSTKDPAGFHQRQLNKGENRKTTEKMLDIEFVSSRNPSLPPFTIQTSFRVFISIHLISYSREELNASSFNSFMSLFSALEQSKKLQLTFKSFVNQFSGMKLTTVNQFSGMKLTTLFILIIVNNF